MKLTTAAQMKELDRQAIEERGIPSLDLMERAAAGVAEAALALLPQRPGKCRGAALCGAGNNGGDGIAAARLLFLKGLKVRAFLVGDYEKLTPDALEETRRLSECGVELERFDPADESQRAWVLGCDVVVDALFGVGLSRPIGAGTPFAAAVDWMNESRAAVVAADIASGVAADTGAVLGRAVRADRTVTFTLPKVGQAVGQGAVLSGNVEVRDIGIPADLVRGLVCRAQTVERDFARAALPPRRADGHKGTFGKVLIIGGAVGYTGAPLLTAAAAVRTGCGLVFLGVPETIWPVEAAKCVSAMPFPLPDKHGRFSPKAKEEILERAAGCDAVALGPGLGRGDGVTELVLDLLREIQQKKGTATVLVTHDLGVVARAADRVAVMYAGKIVETGTVEDIFYDPRHPYTWALMRALPAFSKGQDTLPAIPGLPPTLIDPPPGDAFAPRNAYAMQIDYEEEPPMFRISDTHFAATWLLDPRAPKIECPIRRPRHG